MTFEKQSWKFRCSYDKAMNTNKKIDLQTYMPDGFGSGGPGRIPSMQQTTSNEADFKNGRIKELKANMINAIMLAIKSMDREAHDKQRMVIERRSMRIGS